jgi:hypothetical protein
LDFPNLLEELFNYWSISQLLKFEAPHGRKCMLPSFFLC